MKFLSTILVFLSAYTVINGKPSTGSELVTQVDQIFQTNDKFENVPPTSQPNYGSLPRPNLTPSKKGADGCVCLPPLFCTNNTQINAMPCTGSTCGTVSMRINDGSCSKDQVRCCRDGIDSTNSGTGMASNSMPETSDCPCIPYYQCDNGTACTDGCGIIDMRINDGTCSSPNVRCCKKVNISTMTSVVSPIIPARPNLTQGIPPTPYCPCLRPHQCENGIPCTDGCNAIDIKSNDGTCQLPNVLCCKEVNDRAMASVVTPIIPTRPNLTQGIPSTPYCPCLRPHQCENGVPCTDGCNAIDIKSNDGTCQLPNVLCCKEVYQHTMTSVVTPIIPARPNLTQGIPPTPSCPCLRPHQCENGIPCTDGCNAIDMRINGGICQLPNILCCNGVNNGTTNSGRTPTIPNPVDQMSSCPCIPYFQCTNGTPCTDGCDVINVRINDGNCMAPNVRCCKGALQKPPVGKPDFTPHGGDMPSCPCIPHYNCYNGVPCTEGCGVIDMRMNHDSCKSPNVLCCKQNNTVFNNDTSSRTNAEKPEPSTFKSKGCGARNPNGVGFRTLDLKTNLANFGEFPWMVAILWEDDDTSGIPGYYSEQTLLKYQCGGSLIHPQVVLTSTHCVISKEKIFRVRAGEWNVSSTTEIYPHQDRKVKKVITHPEYYSGGLYNDIALLILETPVNITSNVDTVCLPNQDEILEDIRCYTSGWGTNVFEMNGQFETILKKVQLPIVQKDRCQDQLRTARSQTDFILHESFVCAGGEKGKDACEGDGGSPLMCPFSKNLKRYYQAGIVSWGMGCGLENVPGLYANVARFRNWIDEHMRNLNYDTSFYTY